jgi:formamidopyrimidine-DNA glycosylase
VPELPDLTVYREALEARVRGQVLQRLHVRNPFVLRTADPPHTTLEGRRVASVERIGKRIVLGFDDDLWLAIHLMIAGRLRWLASDEPPPGRITLTLLEFASGVLALTEAGTKRRASLHVLKGAAALAELDAGGLEIADANAATFAARLRAENHTLKRALTDPRILSGIGNAYSDEILHRARLSPIAHTGKLDDAAFARLLRAAQEVLREATERLRADAGAGFPRKVTAFRPEMAVHGKYGTPCPACGTRVRRIVYAENECNYCPTCQTGGVVLADRALSRLLHKSWPREA